MCLQGADSSVLLRSRLTVGGIVETVTFQNLFIELCEINRSLPLLETWCLATRREVGAAAASDQGSQGRYLHGTSGRQARSRRHDAVAEAFGAVRAGEQAIWIAVGSRGVSMVQIAAALIAACGGTI